MCRLERHRRHGFIEMIAEIEINAIELEATGLDLGEIENVVDEREQIVGRGANHFQVFALLDGKRGVERELGHADDAVHGSANLMAHIGQKGALGPIGRLGGFLGRLKLFLESPPLGHIARNAASAHDRASRIAQRQLGGGGPGVGAIGPSLALFGHEPRAAAFQELQFIVARLLGMLVGKKVGVAFAHRLRRIGEAKPFGHGPIDAHKTARGVFEIHAVRHIVHQRAELPLLAIEVAEQFELLMRMAHRALERGRQKVGLGQVIGGAGIHGAQVEGAVVVGRENQDRRHAAGALGGAQ